MTQRRQSRQASSGPSCPLLERRLQRLRRHIAGTTRPIVWLRGVAGAGKSRLTRTLAGDADGAPWTFLDDPSPDGLRAHLARYGQVGGKLGRHSARRLLIATRSSSAAAGLLQRPEVYGQIDLIDESQLFALTQDCRSRADRDVLRQTGGWPLLIDAQLADRADSLRELLPEFLQREVLPELSRLQLTALFASLLASPSTSAPLPAAAYPFPASGEWIAEALNTLRAKPGALPRAVVRDLIEVYAALPDPTEAILSLIDLGRMDQALKAFDRAGGMFYGYRHGHPALARVLTRFGPDRERRSDTLFLAELSLLIKRGQPRHAKLRLDARFPDLPIDFRRVQLTHRPYALLMRIDVAIDVDETPPLEIILSWGRLEAVLNPSDHLAKGILYNTMAIGFMQADALVQARELAQEALAAYQRARSPYLAHYMHLHLCDLALRQSRLREAAGHWECAGEALRASTFEHNFEPVVVDFFRARIAYEEGRFSECPDDVDPFLDALSRGDSWPDLFTTVTRLFAFGTFWKRGLRPALDTLDRCALTLSRRHGPKDEDLRLLRIRLLQSARRHAEAETLLGEHDVNAPARRSAHTDIEEGLIRLRQLIWRPAHDEAALTLARILAARPELEPRQRIAAHLLRAHLEHRSGSTGPARRHLGAALRDAEREGLLGVLVEDAQFLERLLPVFIADPGAGNATLGAFAQRVLQLLRTLPALPAHSRAQGAVSRQEHRVLSYLNDAYTNKQIARALNISESTVKFHLRGLFRKFSVASRGALKAAARRRNILT